jgi:hypothetical protein
VKRTLLMTVEDVFDLGDRTVLTPGVASGGPIFRNGQRVELVRPDGSRFESTVFCEVVSASKPPEFRPLAVGPGVTKDDVPIGTEVWLLEDVAE